MSNNYPRLREAAEMASTPEDRDRLLTAIDMLVEMDRQHEKILDQIVDLQLVPSEDGDVYLQRITLKDVLEKDPEYEEINRQAEEELLAAFKK